ncbi:MAG: prenyltransferase/squalene oxidase repeat-containing protein [Planctomycetota bacterium]
MSFGSVRAALAGCVLAAALPASAQAPVASPASPPTPATSSAPSAQDAPVTDADRARAEQEAMTRTYSTDDALTSVKRSVQFLLDKQNPDGSWGTSTVESLFELNYSKASFYAWKVAGGAISTMALMKVDETPERRVALERALQYLVSTDRPKRGNDWDIDNNWAALYVFICLVEAANDPRFQSADWQKRFQERGTEYFQHLAANQEPKGGWGYYEGPVVGRHPSWSTSFATACVIPALVEAKEMGWPIDQKVIDGAVHYVQACALPNGAYQYDLRTVIPTNLATENIDNVKGSLGRIQVCNWALRKAGVASVTDDVARRGLGFFFEDHKFLDVARWKPVPHESYYANAGYFYFFGHYHAAQLINTLPAAEREAWHAKLRPHLVKTQMKDGSQADFPGSFYSWTYGTGFAILALELGLHPERFERARRAAKGKEAK